MKFQIILKYLKNKILLIQYINLDNLFVLYYILNCGIQLTKNRFLSFSMY